MYERRFSAWTSWAKRKSLAHSERPGVYIVARSSVRLDGQLFRWRDDIIYIGMTNSAAGLQGRLRQFDDTIRGSRVSHGGADRVRYRYRSYSHLSSKLYVAIAHFVCDPTSMRPPDLKIMGRVASFEYVCFAEYAKRYKRLPLFNDRSAAKRSRAKS